MPPKQKAKAELRQQIQELTERLREAEGRMDGDAHAMAQQRAEEAEQRVVELEQGTTVLKGRLGEIQEEVREKIEGVEEQLAGEREHASQLEQLLEEARDEVDKLEWKLEMGQKDAELKVARAREQAQADHRKEMETRDELIALLKEKLEHASGQKEAVKPSSGSGCAKDNTQEWAKRSSQAQLWGWGCQGHTHDCAEEGH